MGSHGGQGGAGAVGQLAPHSGPPSLRSWQMKGALAEIIQLAALDSDPWVLMVADILKSFPDTGSLNLDLEEQNPNVQDILGELREKGMSRTSGCAGRREEAFLSGVSSRRSLTRLWICTVQCA